MAILRFFANFIGGGNIEHRAYRRLMAQSRALWLYRDAGVPDTLDGRFESAVLHVAIVHAVLSKSEEMHGNRQKILELFVTDMDACMREMGVSDSGIAKKITGMAEHLYGRIVRYTAGLKAAQKGEIKELEAAIMDNINSKGSAGLAVYALESFEHFDKAEKTSGLDWLEWSFVKDKGQR